MIKDGDGEPNRTGKQNSKKVYRIVLIKFLFFNKKKKNDNLGNIFLIKSKCLRIA